MVLRTALGRSVPMFDIYSFYFTKKKVNMIEYIFRVRPNNDPIIIHRKLTLGELSSIYFVHSSIPYSLMYGEESAPSLECPFEKKYTLEV